MSDLKPDHLEQRIDSVLGRLPQWEPPVDFAARLAAAAARQAQMRVAPPALLRTGELLHRLSDSALIVLAALSVAGLLAWAVPWAGLADSADLLVWVTTISLGIAGLWMTRRVLFSP